jgi:hypothetical protein
MSLKAIIGNPLESLKSKMRAKPDTDEQVMKKIRIKNPIQENIGKVDVAIQNVKVADVRDKHPGFDISELNARLKENNLSLVKEAQAEVEIRNPIVEEAEEEVIIIKPKAKKLKSKPVLKLVEELEGEHAPLIEAVDLDAAPDENLAPELVEVEEIQGTKKRRTPKPQKGVAVLSPEEWVPIDGTDVIERLPAKEPSVIYKVSSYYMNNREIFVSFINSLLENYRDEVLDDTNAVTCDTIGNSSEEVSLLTHQKIVRDYLNLYTPYRGLLLFFGLGAGKTLSSIAIAEGMKSAKKVIIMLPASLRRNYIEELKKGGDPLYRKNQYWEWISIVANPEALETLSSVLNLTVEYIKRKKGAWLVNAQEKESNYEGLSSSQKKSLNEQLEEMIESKYTFINYNGLRRDKFSAMSDNFERNIFDDSVVVIDEAHNFVSRIVNKLSKEKEIETDPKTGKKQKVSIFLSLIMYEMLLRATNVKIVLLSGTPIINYPNELGIMFNILRGYIKTWEIPLNVKTSGKVNQAEIERIFASEKLHDYVEYSSANKKLMITRNPFGFENKMKKDGSYHGVSNEQKERRDPETGKMVFFERGQESDADFERKIIRILRDVGIEVLTGDIHIHMNKALPDKLDDFLNLFVDAEKGTIRNSDLFKRRIMGLTSYFRSAQEELLPRYEKLPDFKVIKVPMSDYQFVVYELARAAERKQESNNKKKKGTVDENGIYKEPASTYRIFSRLYCNFVMPRPPGRPVPLKKGEESEPFVCPKEEEIPEAEAGTELELDQFYAQEQARGDAEMLENIIESADKMPKEREARNLNEDEDMEKDGDEALERIGDKTYPLRVEAAFECLKKNASKYLSKSALEKYSPKYLNILENIEDPDHLGNHLVYSFFRTLEGIGIFTLVLEYNGFTRFKIKKGVSGDWELDISPENRGKPTYALYTGTESAEEKEMVRNVYNGDWPEGSRLTQQLKEIANNNNMGEIIKVFMITASGSEGINLRNTRYVHIMEPYWNPARIDQVVGRARRICSHKALPQALQTVEVFLYLMTFTRQQIDSDGAIELKLKDKSKKKYPVAPGSSKLSELPFTSDEVLYEISSIKEEVSDKLITAIKESSIDCAIYSRKGSKEQLHCLQFPDAKPSDFSYVPSLKKEEKDSTKKINKELIEWRGKVVKLKKKPYISREINPRLYYIYDLESYQQALEVPGLEPTQIGILEIDRNGAPSFKKI